MAHNINYNKQKKEYSFFSVKEKAWHNLGQLATSAQTSEEAIKLANLDFDVVKVPNFICIDGQNVQTDSFSNIRADNLAILSGKIGSQYEVVQNREAFAFFDSIVGEKLAIFETAGCLGGGETIFITAKLPDYIRIINSDDVIEKYLLLTLSHDGSGTIISKFTGTRVVCNNTLRMALNDANASLKIKHNRNVHQNLQKARELLGLIDRRSIEQEMIFNKMAKTRFDENNLIPTLAKIFLNNDEYIIEQNKLIILNDKSRKDRKIDVALEYYFTGPGQDMESTKGTVWGVYNAITGYMQNVQNYKNEEVKFKNTMLNSNKIVSKAIEILV